MAGVLSAEENHWEGKLLTDFCVQNEVSVTNIYIKTIMKLIDGYGRGRIPLGKKILTGLQYDRHFS